jgi:hypothetical protein
MKKQIFTIILLLMGGVSTFGQFRFDGGTNSIRFRNDGVDRMFITPLSLGVGVAGNVGIGTTTPDAKLTVNGDIAFKNIARFTTNGGYTATNRNGASVLIFEAGGVLNGIAGGVDGMLLYVLFGYKMPTTTTTGALVIKHEENVSEGNAANRIMTHTGADFTITSGVGGVIMIYDGGRQRWRIMEVTSGAVGWGLIGNSGTNPATDFIGTTDAQPLVVKTNSTERMRILSTGNIGIGTTTPDTKLHIQDGSAGSVTSFSGSMMTLENDKDAVMNFLSGTGSASGLYFGSALGNSKGGLIYTSNINTMNFITDANSRISISGIGNVGIGTTAPTAKLDVNGDVKLTVTNISPATTSTFDPLDRQSKSYVSINSTAGTTITINGISAPSNPATSIGTFLYISVGSGATVIIKNNASAVSANTINTYNGSDWTITNRGGVILIYDVDGWRMIGGAG